jgi:PAS domain-containing protein
MEVPWPLVLAFLIGAAAPATMAWVWRGRWHSQRRRHDADRAHWQQVFDALDIGLLVLDANDRVRAWNADYRRLYPQIAEGPAEGQAFEALLRRAIEIGLVPEAAGREAAWIAERIAQHRQPRDPLLRRMADGRWRRITERYLADGGMLSYSIDVTQLVEQGQALQQARQEVEGRQTRLQEALDLLPLAFTLYDADDRLLLASAHTREMFPLVRGMLDQRPTFADIVRANHAAGGLPELSGDIEAWIASRETSRRSPGGAAQMVHVDGRWLRVFERRLSDGGLVCMHLDVSAEVQERDNAEQARRRLEDAIEALPDGFALFDRDDRLLLCNERYRALYRESAPAIRPGAGFEDLLRYGLAHGQYPEAVGQEAAWLAERLRTHHEPGPPVLQELPGNRWLRIDERRTRDGGVAGVRADVTALVRREQTLERLNQELDESKSRLERLLAARPGANP